MVERSGGGGDVECTSQQSFKLLVAKTMNWKCNQVIKNKNNTNMDMDMDGI